MSLVVLENVSLGFGRKRLFEGLDLRVDQRDRIGLVGPNGSGKTSLMRILAGEGSPDGGGVRVQGHLRRGYLPQDIPVLRGQSVLETVLRAVPGRATLESDLRSAEAELEQAEAAGDEDQMMSAAAWIADLHLRAADFERFYSEHEAHRILAGLGFADADQGRDLGELSGGWKMRAMLAALLFQRPELLLLDEPTNHLDLPSVAWFGEFLRRYPHAFVLICHDREFLDEQIERVVSLEPEGVRQFRGDYEHYVRQRAEEEVVLENQAKNLAREREKAEQFIDRFRAQANKAKAVQSRIKQLEKMEAVQTFTRRKVMRFTFPPTGRCGSEVLRLDHLRQAYGDHVVLDDVELWARRGEKIGIIGVNGAGKTTLLKTIAGELKASGGEVRLGHGVKVGYYAQHHADALDASRTVFEEVAACNRNRSATDVRTLLGAFLFSDEDVDKPIAVLSGGERARVALAKMLVDPGNLLLMDEPTNHLDLASSESLADSLGTFDGTLVFVSHNRSFVRRLATRIWNVEGGRVEPYPGTLDEYLARHRGDGTSDGAEAPAPPEPSRPPAAAAPRPSSTPAPPADPRPAQSRAEKRARKREEARERAELARRVGPLRSQVQELESRIEGLEEAQRRRNLELADPAVYGDEARRQQLLGDYQRDASALAEATDAWELAQLQLEEAEGGG